MKAVGTERESGIRGVEKGRLTLSLIGIVLIYAVSVRDTQTAPWDLVAGLPQMWDLLTRMWPPHLPYLKTMVGALLETLRMALLATTLGALLSVPINVLAARNITPGRWLYYPARGFLNLIRTIPNLMLAATLVAAVGIGPLAGLLALTIFSFGIMAKLTSESIEGIDPGPVEAAVSSGANLRQIAAYAVVPQVLPHFVGYALYVLEVNVRAAAVLGLVGAGGIGQWLMRDLNLFRYRHAAAILCMIAAVVVTIELLGARIREHLLSGATRRASFPQHVRWRSSLLAVALSAFYVWLFTGFEVKLDRLLHGVPGVVQIVKLMIPPNFEYAPNVVSGLASTLQIALLGTTTAALLAVPIAFCAAKNAIRFAITTDVRIPTVSAARWLCGSLSGIAKSALTMVRTFPEILLAVLFMRAVGPGAFAGVLAIAVHSIGMIGKLYAEAVESIDPGGVEALAASGAGRIQVLWVAVMPQVLPEFLTYILYRFEINVRAATVLGLVGAGGIGTPLLFNLQSRQWENIATIMIGVVTVISWVDYGSATVRRKIVQG